ncbi:hypothetical protein, partial [Polymorphobacter multimanifer]|uniref:hypothetical protein n=1 Tax=Polymorphobacter multimanifer TaxID=1070431 RepID=UPI001FB136D6
MLNATEKAEGGQGADADFTPETPVGRGGNAVGGRALAAGYTANGELTAGDVVLDASGIGGDGGRGGFASSGQAGSGGIGGSGFGGTATFGVASGTAAITTFNGGAEAGNVQIFAQGSGGRGGNGGFASVNPGGNAGDGGEARGGTAVLVARGVDVEVGDLVADVTARGGQAGQAAGTGALRGADGVGGAARSDLSAANAAIAVSPHAISGGTGAEARLGNVQLTANAIGGSADNGTGGEAVAGTASATILQAAGTEPLTGRIVAQQLVLGARAQGGLANRGAGGAATGGTALVDVVAGELTASLLLADADGQAGSVGFGTTGDGTGGTATLRLAGGSVEISEQTALYASGFGATAVGTGAGGDGRGGLATMIVTAAGGAASLSSLLLRADGEAGRGSQGGGLAIGGISRLDLDGGAVTLSASFSAEADARGGDIDFGSGYGVLPGAAAGDGLAGLVELTVDNASLSVLGSTELRAYGEGGSGNLAAASRGDGRGGTISIVAGNIAPGSIAFGDVSIDAGARGSDAADGNGNTVDPGTGGNGFAGTINVQAIGVDSLIETAALRVEANAMGGRGGNSSEGVDAGAAGGAGVGGTIEVAARLGAQARFGTVEQLATGTGGSGGRGAEGEFGLGGEDGGPGANGERGGDGGSGSSGGLGGRGQGGTARLLLHAPQGNAELVALAVTQLVDG